MGNKAEDDSTQWTFWKSSGLDWTFSKVKDKFLKLTCPHYWKRGPIFGRAFWINTWHLYVLLRLTCQRQNISRECWSRKVPSTSTLQCQQWVLLAWGFNGTAIPMENWNSVIDLDSWEVLQWILSWNDIIICLGLKICHHNNRTKVHFIHTRKSFCKLNHNMIQFNSLKS